MGYGMGILDGAFIGFESRLAQQGPSGFLSYGALKQASIVEEFASFPSSFRCVLWASSLLVGLVDLGRNSTQIEDILSFLLSTFSFPLGMARSADKMFFWARRGRNGN